MTDETKPAGEATDDEERTTEFAHSDRIKRPDAVPPTDAPGPSPAAERPAEQTTTDDHVIPPPAPTTLSKPDDAGEPPDDEKPEAAKPEAKKPKAPTTERPPLVPLLAATTVVLFITTALFGLMAFAPRIAPIKSSATRLAARAQEEESLKTIARRFAANFVTIDYLTIDADLKRMTADATTDFADKLKRTVDAIGPQFKKRKASSSGHALDAAVLSHEKDSAIVQVLLRRTKKNVGTKGPETGNQVVNVTLVKTDNGWKVDDLNQLGAQGQ